MEMIFKQMDLNEDGRLDPRELHTRLSGLEIEVRFSLCRQSESHCESHCDFFVGFS